MVRGWEEGIQFKGEFESENVKYNQPFRGKGISMVTAMLPVGTLLNLFISMFYRRSGMGICDPSYTGVREAGRLLPKAGWTKM